MRKRFIDLAVLILLAVSACLYQSCCKDCPIAPQPLEWGNYRLYAHDMYLNLLVSIDTPADTLVDSVRLNYDCHRIFITPDGERILAPRNDGPDNKSTEIYRASDLSHIETINLYGDYYFDKTDNIGINYSKDSSVYFIDPESLTPIDSISGLPNLGDFYLDTTSNLLYSPVDLDNWVYIIDCNNRILTDSINIGGFVYSPVYSRLTNEIYFLSDYHLLDAMPGLYCYEIDNDTIRKIANTYGRYGSISLSPDGTILYMTDGGDVTGGYVPRGNIWVYNVYNRQVDEIISPVPFLETPAVPPIFGQILITPDNSRAYIGSNFNNTIGPVPVAEVDLSESKMTRKMLDGIQYGATSIAIGPVPTE
jgi:hypothetical protein